ncbi:kinase-like domain-containing protein [Flagelloscypha sp. PMI_526]|nr:kinase-like domain-containing protein [Flagelloscypha sp. PMI_526]
MHVDPQFTRLLHAVLPLELGVYHSSVQTNHLELSQAIAVTTPSRQCLWVVYSSKPQSVLLHPNQQGLEGVLAGLSDREIFDELGQMVDNTAIQLCAMDVFQWGVDWMPNERHKGRCFRILRKLVKKHQTVPPSLRITDILVDAKPFSGGGFSDVYHGRIQGVEVCVKVLRFFMTDGQRQKVRKDFCREALLWRQLQHPNILPFLGFNEELFTPSFCLVSPLMMNGNVRTFLERNPHHSRVKILLDIAEGINYLHSFCPPIVHGDIRGANVLVKSNFDCCIGDLGLSLIAESGGIDSTSRNTHGGACRWMAPELLDSQFSLHNPDKRKRDIYAFGCTALEIWTNAVPFANQPFDYMVCLDITHGRRPLRPRQPQVPDWLWTLIEICWQEAPTARPSISLILSSLKPHDPESLIAQVDEFLHSSMKFPPITFSIRGRVNYEDLVWKADPFENQRWGKVLVLRFNRAFISVSLLSSSIIMSASEASRAVLKRRLVRRILAVFIQTLRKIGAPMKSVAWGFVSVLVWKDIGIFISMLLMVGCYVHVPADVSEWRLVGWFWLAGMMALLPILLFSRWYFRH